MERSESIADNLTQSTILYDWHTEQGAPSQDVKIRKAANGFIVEVGCKTFVAKTWKEASEGLELYWEEPALAEKKYCKEK